MTGYSWYASFRSIFKGSLPTYGRTGACLSCETQVESVRYAKWWLYNIRKFTNHPALKRAVTTVNDKLDVMSQVFARQCNAVVVQRIRRSAQILNLYSQIYNEYAVRYFVARLGQRIMQNSKGYRVRLMLGATMFSWAQERVSDQEIQEAMDEVFPNSATSSWMESTVSSLLSCVTRHVASDGWEQITNQDNLRTWRRPLQEAPHLYEYKVCGSFYDIPARAFFAVQLDLAYRKQWDRLVISLDCVDTDTEQQNSEVVRWVTHYPYPMYSREYVYVRRYMVDAERNAMVLVSKAVDHPDFPVNDKYVRVHTYNSSMVIRPHSTFDENGMDYVLTYHDDPQAAFPTLAYNWMASTGVPDFMEKLHCAARQIVLRNWKYRPVIDEQSEGVACYS